MICVIHDFIRSSNRNLGLVILRKRLKIVNFSLKSHLIYYSTCCLHFLNAIFFLPKTSVTCTTKNLIKCQYVTISSLKHRNRVESASGNCAF
ncbi:hypothetical protein B9Z55_022261 [Caenorhabditis nigoni]|uniref:Uncharacterized protein n=1 Tax=Caenorhabditis nigoni TaxID=1611254 RepID=A0A2G5SJZ7_9PELO|nr:hypothetical protein B9Z55_022261 [Caenorhabditis nigoni]